MAKAALIASALVVGTIILIGLSLLFAAGGVALIAAYDYVRDAVRERRARRKATL